MHSVYAATSACVLLYREIIQGAQEREKVWHHVARTHCVEHCPSQHHNGAKFMTALDLLAAVVPTYPPTQSTAERLGSLDGEKGSQDE